MLQVWENVGWEGIFPIGQEIVLMSLPPGSSWLAYQARPDWSTALNFSTDQLHCTALLINCAALQY